MPKKKPPYGVEPTEAQWWRASELEMAPHEVLDRLMDQIERDQASRYSAYRQYARLFDSTPEGLGSDDLEDVRSGLLSQNELSSTIETLHAQVFKNRMVPAVAANESDYREWTRAKDCSRWIEGVMDAAKVHYEAMPQSGLDMLVYGTGFIKVGHDEDVDGVCTLTFERTEPQMIFVDRLEARHGKPRSMYQKSFVDKFLLLASYQDSPRGAYGTPQERISGIMDCSPNNDDDMDIRQISTTMLTVREAWHLPSKKGAKDGRHVIWVKGCTLVDEPWEWDRFPFAVLRYGTRLKGYYGKSAVQILAATQMNHDKLNAKIDEAQDIMGVPRIILLKGAGLTKSHIDDIPGGILEVNMPNAIQEWNATAISSEIYAERASAPDKMRSLLGVSQFDTQNQLPGALREVSGPALERLIDSGTARHAMTHAELERATVDLAYLAIDYAADLQREGKNLIVTAPGRSKESVETLSFKEVQIDRARMKLIIQAMSQMPQTFAGKIEQFSKLRESGDIDRQTYMRMLQVPDVRGATDMLGSDEEIILKNIDFMVRKGEYLSPLQYDNLELIVQVTTRFINWYRIREDADADIVGVLGQYIEAALALTKGLGSPDEGAPPPVPPGQPMPPQAMPPQELPPGADPSMMAPMGAEGLPQ